LSHFLLVSSPLAPNPGDAAALALGRLCFQESDSDAAMELSRHLRGCKRMAGEQRAKGATRCAYRLHFLWNGKRDVLNGSSLRETCLSCRSNKNNSHVMCSVPYQPKILTVILNVFVICLQLCTVYMWWFIC